MWFSTPAVVVAILGWIGVASAHNIQLQAHSRECFHEQLHRDDKMTVTFQVGDREFGGSGNLEIDFWVRLSQSQSTLPSLSTFVNGPFTILGLTNLLARSKILPAPSKDTTSPSQRATIPS